MAIDNSQTLATSNPRARWPLARIGQWVSVVVIVAIAEIVFLAGYTLTSLAIDGVAVATFYGFSRARARELD